MRISFFRESLASHISSRFAFSGMRPLRAAALPVSAALIYYIHKISAWRKCVYDIKCQLSRPPEKGYFRPFVSIWFSVFPEGQNYIWDVFNYLKCNLTHVLCEYPSMREGFLKCGEWLFRQAEKACDFRMAKIYRLCIRMTTFTSAQKNIRPTLTQADRTI